jgi:circadian clock protein KaiC
MTGIKHHGAQHPGHRRSSGRSDQEPLEVQRESGFELIEDRVSTGVDGFDALIDGGFPRGSLVLMAGEAGSGKTIFSAQYLYHGGSRIGEPGIYVSFAENRQTFLGNMKKLNMDFQRLEQEGKFKFLDYATITEKAVTETLTNVLSEMDRLKARRLVIDPFTALAQAFKGPIDARIAVHTILGKMLRQAGCTTLLIAEKTSGVRQIGLGIEEFVADGVVLLALSSERGHLERRLQVIKMRGTKARKEGVRYDIKENGITIYPPRQVKPIKEIYSKKLSTGIKGLDEMLDGGLPQASVTMVAGGSGTGKTTIALHFIVEGAKRHERGLFVSLEEPEAKLIRYGEGFGWDMKGFLNKGLVVIKYLALDRDNVNEQFLQLNDLLGQLQPARFVIDSVTSIERAMARDEYVEHMKTWNSSLAADGVTVLFTAPSEATTPVTDMEISTLVDNVISLRDLELDSSLKRALTVFKARGLAHDRDIREFEITPRGVTMKGKFAGAWHIPKGVVRRPFAKEDTHATAEPTELG